MAFEGVLERLKRTNENILNLQTEISVFFQEGKYPVIPEDDKKLLLEAIEYHKSRVIPSRFSVLAGEIVHHLRSCLDHVVWEFSTEAYRRDHFLRNEFPVFVAPAVHRDSISLYQRKT